MRAFVEKVVIDAGVGRLSQQPSFEEKILPQVMRDIAAVAGQTPQVRQSKGIHRRIQSARRDHRRPARHASSRETVDFLKD